MKMRLKGLKSAVALLSLVLLPQLALAQGAKDDGKIIEQTPFAPPAFEQVPERFQRLYGREAIERVRNSPDLELLKIKYMSDGLKISGFIYKPKETAGKKLPTVIWNRGGGGADTNDVMNLFPLARALGYVDMERVYMYGFSRGAQMTLQAIRRGAPVRAAAVVGAPTDLWLSFKENPRLRAPITANWAGGEARFEQNMLERSAARWADKLTVPLLIFQGGADPAVSPNQALELARKMEEAGNLYGLVVYARDDHFITRNTEDRLRRAIEWFK